MVINLTIQPCIFGDDNLNLASMRIGPLKTIISGNTKTNLFKNIRDKIWAISGEAKIEDANVAEEYNAWIAQLFKQNTYPKEINDYATSKMCYALPFSEEFKKALRNGKA